MASSLRRIWSRKARFSFDEDERAGDVVRLVAAGEGADADAGLHPLGVDVIAAAVHRLDLEIDLAAAGRDAMGDLDAPLDLVEQGDGDAVVRELLRRVRDDGLLPRRSRAPGAAVGLEVEVSILPPGKSPLTVRMFFSHAICSAGVFRGIGAAQPASRNIRAIHLLIDLSYASQQKAPSILLRSGKAVTIDVMKGSVVYLYAFDIANEIQTELVHEVLSQKPFPFQIRIGAAAPRDMPIYAPLTISMKPQEVASNVGPVTLKPFVKIFNVGAISISYEVAFEKPSLSDLVPYHQLQVGDEPLSKLAERLALQVWEALKPL
jgi:hypothetical protein